MMGSNILTEKVELSLETKDYGKLLEDILKPENLPHIRNEGMELITKLCENGLAFAENHDAITACTNSLMHVVQNYRPKESLVFLLEQIEAFVHSDKFTCLLQPLQFVMLNLPKKREKTFSWVLSTLKSHIKYYHQLPEELKTTLYEGDETFLLEQNPKIKALLHTYRTYIDFYAPFVEQLDSNWIAATESGNLEDIQSVERQRNYLRDYLVDLLGVPLVHFNLHWDENANLLENCETNTNPQKIGPKIKTDARLIAEKLMSFLSIVDKNPTYYFDWINNRISIANEPKQITKKKNPGNESMELEEDEDDDEEEVVVHMSSVVSYFYLIYNQNLYTQKLPSILSPTFMFNTILYPVTTMLKNTSNYLALEKAIRLAMNFLDSCDTTTTTKTSSSSSTDINYDRRLHHDLLETEIHNLFIDRLSYLTVYCQAKVVRTESYRLLRKYLMSFDPRGKYTFLLRVFNTVPNDNLVGLMITELKQFIFISMNPEHPSYEKGLEECFLGASVSRLILTVCVLDEGVTTDLCQNSNKIVSALNLLRFLLIRDKIDNKTGILELFSKIEEKMLNPLRKALDLSRAHYELKLKELNDPHQMKGREEEEKRLFGMCDLQIGDKNLKPGDISLKEQKASVVNAINNFDHMSGLIAWVNEASVNIK